jgi:hypothetical protein
MGFPTSDRSQEEWEMANLCRIQRTQKRYPEGPLPPTFYRSIP